MRSLEVVYFALLAGGAAFAGVGFVASHAKLHGPARGGWGGKIAPFMNLGALAAAAALGGGAGTIALALGASSAGSLLAAAAFALAGGASVAKLVAWLALHSRYEVARSPSVATALTAFSGARVGEVIWICGNGVRRPLPARSEGGERIERGTEVVVLAVERGIARVVPAARWFQEEKEERHGYEA